MVHIGRAGPFMSRRHRGLSIEWLEPRRLLAADPTINEFLARNDSGLRDGDDRSSDWIEIFNRGDEALDLAGYQLTNDPRGIDNWVFPSTVLEAGEYIVVFASGKDESSYVDPGGNLHTDFTLRRGGDYLALLDPNGSIVSEYGQGGTEFPEQLTNVSYGAAQSFTLLTPQSRSTYAFPLDDRFDDQWKDPSFDDIGNGFTTGTASLGFEERPTNRVNFEGEFETRLPDGTFSTYVRLPFELADISAVTSLSLSMLYDNGFVAYLNGVQVAEDNAPANPAWFSTAPENSRRDSVILDEGSLQFDLSEHVDALVAGKNVLGIHLMNHTRDLSDMLLIAGLSGASSDLASTIGVEQRVGYMPEPTPGEANVSNDRVFPGFVQDTTFSIDRGFYDTPFEVEIATDSEGAQIRYTIDGSSPTAEHGTIYANPITIDKTTTLRAAAFIPGFLPTNVDTQSYLFLNDVLTQDGAGLPETWGTFPFGSTEAASGSDVPANYEVDPEIVNDPRYKDTFLDDLHSLPTLSIVMDPDHLWDPDIGIYTNTMEEGVAWERPVSAELVGADGEEQFQIDAGVRIHGGFGRRPAATAKHSLRLLFKEEYGDSKLQYDWFGEGAVDRFDTIVLRANYNYSWARGNRTGTQTGKDYTMIADRWGSVTQQEMGGLAPRGTFVHLYINGLYWGVYNPNERPDASFQAQHRGGDKDDYDVINHGGVTDGNNEAWRELRSLLRQDPIDYAAVRDMLDVDNFIDYMILNQFGGNGDWPQNNWYASRRRAEGEKWQFHSWDTEFFFITLNQNRVIGLPNSGPGEIHNALKDVEEYRVRFGDRIHLHLFNDGVLTPEKNIARHDMLAAPLDRAVVGESSRWGDAFMNQVSPPRTRDDDWLPRLEELRTDYFPRRNDIVVRQYVRDDLYPSIDAPEFNQHGGTISKGFQLTIENSNNAGIVYYTLDGTDPRLAGGDVSPMALSHDDTAITLDQSQLVMARIRNDGQWSALARAHFQVDRLPGDSNGDGVFNQADIVQVLQAAKYGTGQPATFAEGDWNDDGLFNQLDIVAALQTGAYQTGPAAVRAIDSYFAKDSSRNAKDAPEEATAPFGT